VPLWRPRARAQQEMRHRCNRGQRLAEEAERQDRCEIVGPADLARGMALDREPRVVRFHPLAVVLDANLPFSAQLDSN